MCTTDLQIVKCSNRFRIATCFPNRALIRKKLSIEVYCINLALSTRVFYLIDFESFGLETQSLMRFQLPKAQSNETVSSKSAVLINSKIIAN